MQTKTAAAALFLAIWGACVPQAAAPEMRSGAPAVSTAPPAPTIVHALRDSGAATTNFRPGPDATESAPALPSRPVVFIANEIE